MPFPNEHAARIEEPEGFLRCRRQNDKLGKGVHAVFCVRRSDGKAVLQSVRFDRKKFTPDEARAWLRERGLRPKTFEPASGGGAARR